MNAPPVTVVPIERIGHFVTVPVEIAGRRERFVVDSGIGITVVGTELASAVGEPTQRTFSGRRMSGQEIEAPLVRLPDLRVGDYCVTDPIAGVADLGDGFAGILGPDAFADTWWSVDAAARTLSIGSHGAPPPVEPATAVVRLDVHEEGPARSYFAPLVLPSGRTITVEIDTGSGCLILDTSLMAEVGVDPDQAECTSGVDETGHEWVRRWGTVEGAVHLAAAPATAQERPRVTFQDIIYDGLLGAEYLDRFRYGFDVARRELRLAPLSGGSRAAPRCPARPSPRRW